MSIEQEVLVELRGLRRDVQQLVFVLRANSSTQRDLPGLDCDSMSSSDVCRYLKISRWQLQTLMKRGLKYTRLSGSPKGRLTFLKADVDRFRDGGSAGG